MAKDPSSRRSRIEGLFDGRDAPRDAELQGVAAFFGALRSMGAQDLPHGLEDRHLIAIRQTLSELGTGSLHPRGWFRSPRLRPIWRSLAVKVVALTAPVFLAGSALAATGSLPVIQDQVADALDFVVHLPGRSDDPAAPRATKPPADDSDKQQPVEPEAQFDEVGEDGAGTDRQTTSSSGVTVEDLADGRDEAPNEDESEPTDVDLGENEETDEDEPAVEEPDESEEGSTPEPDDRDQLEDSVEPENA